MLAANAMTPDTPPLISVIVVCRNPGQRLEPALASVWDQRDASFELIVIDGASTDGSAAWLEAQRARIARLISEPDRGVYEAMNKGIAAARGEWLLFLGADDRLAADTTLRDAASALKSASSDIAAGEAAYTDGRIYRLKNPPNPIARNFLHHQATFYRHALFARLGAFDANLAVMGDYDFNVRALKAGASIAPLALRVSVCGTRGLSDAGHWRGYREEITVRHRYFSAWKCAAWDIASALRFARKKLLRLV